MVRPAVSTPLLELEVTPLDTLVPEPIAQVLELHSYHATELKQLVLNSAEKDAEPPATADVSAGFTFTEEDSRTK